MNAIRKLPPMIGIFEIRKDLSELGRVAASTLAALPIRVGRARRASARG